MTTLNYGSYPLNQSEIYSLASGLKFATVYPTFSVIQISSDGLVWTVASLSGGAGNIAGAYLRSATPGAQITLTRAVAITDKVYYKTFTLTHAQILTLPTTKVTLVPAQGDGTNRVLIPLVNEMVFTFNWAADYTNVTIGSAFRVTVDAWSNTPHWHILPRMELRFFFAPGTNVTYQPIGNEITTNGTDGQYRAEYSTPICLEVTANSGNFTGGNANNTLDVLIPYRIYDMTLKGFV